MQASMLRTPPQELQSNLMTLHILLAQDQKALPFLSTEEQNTLRLLSTEEQNPLSAKALPCQVCQYPTHLYTAAIAVVRRRFLVVLTYTVHQTHLYTAAIAVVWRDFLVALTHTAYQCMTTNVSQPHTEVPCSFRTIAAGLAILSANRSLDFIKSCMAVCVYVSPVPKLLPGPLVA